MTLSTCLHTFNGDVGFRLAQLYLTEWFAGYIVSQEFSKLSEDEKTLRVREYQRIHSFFGELDGVTE